MAFRCPTRDEIAAQIRALLPRGRAWQTHEAGPDPRSVLHRYWGGYADVVAFLTERLCALREEFFCRTQVETNDLWMAEYGLPDACDPFPDLCAKVAALGGTRCEYYSEVAARAGWDIDCIQRADVCGSSAGSCAKAGRAKTGYRPTRSQIIIRVFAATSPAFTGGRAAPPKAGRLKAGRPLACPPDLSGLICLLERVMHAEVDVLYEVV